MLQHVVRRIVALCALVALSATAAAQSAPWRNDWTIQAPPSLQNTELAPRSPVTFGPDGDLLMHAAWLPLDDQLVRFSNTGAVRWHADIDGDTYLFASQSPMLANADGSAYAAIEDGTMLVRINADGSIPWRERFDALFLAATPQAVIAQGCNAVVAFDAADGRLLWRQAVGTAFNCAAGGVVTDGSGASYASFLLDVGNGYDSHLLKIAADGTLLWDAYSPQSILQRVVGTDASRVYTDSSSGAAALAAADGHVLWSVANVSAVGVGGSPAELLVQGANGVQRLNAADGAARWTQKPVGSTLPNSVSCINGNKVVVGSTRLDLTTGAVDWSATLPYQDGNGNQLTFFSVACAPDGTATFAGAQVGPETNPVPVLQRVGDSGTPTAVPMPSVARGVQGTSIVVDAQTVAGVAIDYTAAGTTSAHVRGIDRGTGSTLWQTDIAPPNFFTYPRSPSAGIAAAGGTLAVTMASGYADESGPNCGVYVTAIEPSTGVVRWNANVVSGVAGQFQLGTVSFDPLVDDQGNVIVSYQTEIFEYAVSKEFAQSSVVKLSAADGSILWRHDEVFPEQAGRIAYQFYSAPPIFLIGSDVLLGGSFAAPNDGDSGIKLSGADGSVLWRSDVFSTPTSPVAIYSAAIADDGNPIVRGDGWAKLDAQTGATLWRNTTSVPCINICANGGGQVMLPGGDQLLGSENGSRALLMLLPGHANATPVAWQFDQQDTHLRQSWIDSVDRDASGNIWARLNRMYRHYGQTAAYLVRFDPASGTLVSQQALFLSADDPLQAWVSPLPLAAPENNRLLAQTYSHGPPAPETSGNALLDTTILANGDLSLVLSTDHGDVAPDHPVAFRISVDYSGDAPISGAHLIADFPWPGQASGLACSVQSASNCVVDPHSGSLLASFDMQPGGHINLTGSIVAIGGGSAVPLSAFAVGPTSLNELAPANNSSWATVETTIFRDGFE